MKLSLISATMSAAALFASPVFGASLTIGAGGTGCESLKQIVAFGPFTADMCDVGDSDLSNDAATPDDVTFLGDGMLLGFIKDDEGIDPDRFGDYAYVTLAGRSTVSVMLVNPDDDFDALFTFGGESAVLTTTDTTFSFVSDGGTSFFSIDATKPTDSLLRTDSSYKITISTMPLPAGAVLLLTGLGGLAIARRKTAA